MTPRRGNLRQSFAPLAGSLLAALAGQATLAASGVLVVRILGVEDRGYLALFVLFPAVLAQIGSLGLPLAATYELSSDREHSGEVVRTVGSAALAQAAVLVVLHAGIVALVFADDPARVRFGAIVSLAAVPATLAQSYGVAILQGQQRFAAFNVLRTLPAVAYVAVVLAIFLANGSLDWVVVGWVGSLVLVAAITVLVAVQGIPFTAARRSIESLRRMLRFGVKGLLGWTSPIETFRLDQAVVGLLLSPAALGLYVVGLAFANLPRFVAQSIGYVAYPRVASRKGHEARAEMWQFFWLTLVVSSLVVVGLELTVSWLVPFFFTTEYSGAIPLTRILLVAALFLSARRILTDGAQGLGKPGLGTIAEVTSWLFLVPALAIFTPLLHARGVALALAVSSALSFVVLFVLVVRSRDRTETVATGLLPARGAER
jgi:O-antigen/teichoic acid export membrane protein